MKLENWIFPLFIMGASLMLTNCNKEVTNKDPLITWANPADITYGTLLNGTQLNATADVPGTFVYTPATGSKLDVGANQDLEVDFTPTDASNYNTVTKTVRINVIAPINPTNGKTTAVFNSGVTYGTLTDEDGNIYKTVTIGTQTWMAENLRTTKYKDGTAISNVAGANEWGDLMTGAYCNFNNTNNIDTIATYGRLYNWYAVNTGKLAPVGWHIPTDAEWTKLTDYLGGQSVAGGKLKEIGTTHWDSPNIGATNETGFTALPGGYRDINCTFVSIGHVGDWWSSSERTIYNVYYRFMPDVYSNVYIGYFNKELGLSVRCIKD